jgi:hypothetical protein
MLHECVCVTCTSKMSKDWFRLHLTFFSFDDDGVHQRKKIYEACEFHGGLSEDLDRLGYDAVTLCEWFAMFWRYELRYFESGEPPPRQRHILSLYGCFTHQLYIKFCTCFKEYNYTYGLKTDNNRGVEKTT